MNQKDKGSKPIGSSESDNPLADVESMSNNEEIGGADGPETHYGDWRSRIAVSIFESS